MFLALCKRYQILFVSGPSLYEAKQTGFRNLKTTEEEAYAFTTKFSRRLKLNRNNAAMCKFVRLHAMCKSTLRATLIAIIFVALSTMLVAQQSGSIVGTAADKNGAVIPNAKVTLINTATRDTRHTTTNSVGFFAFSGAEAGDYSVKVESKGFRAAEQSGIHLSPSDRRSLSVSLEVGTADESVTVTAATSGIEVVDSGDLTSTLNSKDIGNLSLQGRDVTELLKTLPGFSNNTSSNGMQNKNGYDTTITSIASAVGNGISAPGVVSRSGGADLVSDGAHILDPGCACNATQTVNPDMVAELKVTTSSYSADGSTGPVVISAVGKSGSSTYHGSAYFHLRDHVLNSNDWDYNYTGLARPDDRYLYPGGQFGGPVPFTHKKLVFFAGYEYYNQSFPESMSGGILKAMLPTVSERTGKFDPTLTDNAAVCSSIASYVSSQYRCQPITDIDTLNGYVGNIANSDVSSYIQPGARSWLQVIPTPNRTPTASTDYNYVKALINSNNGYMFHAKVDYDINSSTKLFVSYNQQHEDYGSPLMRWWYTANEIEMPGDPVSSDLSRTISGSLVKVLNPMTTNEFIASLAYMNSPITLKNPKAYERTTLDYPFYYPGTSAAPTTMMPSIQNNWYTADLGIPQMFDTDRISYFSRKWLPSISDNLTKVWGTHLVKAGFSWVQSGNRQASVSQSYGKSGIAGYEPIWDYSGPGGNQITSAYNPVLNLLLDHAGSFGYQPDTIQDMKDNSFGFFGQDEWKVNKRLTINFGLRFQHETPWVDDTGKYGAAAFTDAWYNADLAAGVSTLPGLRWHAKDSSVPMAGHSYDSMFYGPRFGIIYDLRGTGKTFIRGGIGSYYYHDNLSGYDSATSTSQGGTSCGISTATFLSQIDTGKNVSCANTAAGVGSVTAVDPTDHLEPHTLTYNFTLSQDLGWKSILEITYSGSQSTNLIDSLQDINITPLGAYARTDPNSEDTTYFGQLVSINTISTNPNGSTGVAVQQDYKPYTHYTNLNIIRHRNWANYNALLVSWQKHQGAFNFNVNYTWSKTMGIAETSDPVDIHNDYGILSSNRPHVFNTSYSYEVGDRFKKNKFERAALNGWMISGITVLQSGAPLQQSDSANFNLSGTNTVPSITLPGKTTATKFNTISSTYYLGTSSYTLMPKLTCNPSSGRSGGQYINPSCYALPTSPVFDGNGDLTTLGENGGYKWLNIEGPAYFSSDLTISRTIKFTNRQSAQIKVTGMNFLNHPLKSFDQNNANNINLNYTDGVLATSGSGWKYGVTNEKFGRRVLEISLKYNF